MVFTLPVGNIEFGTIVVGPRARQTKSRLFERPRRSPGSHRIT